MRVTTKARQAVSAMVDLALHADIGVTTVADVAVRQEISVSYLEQLFAKLRRAGLIASSRGPGGGYVLARPANEISAADIVRAVDEERGAGDDGFERTRNRPKSGLIDVDSLWDDVARRMLDLLNGVSLASLAAREEPVRLPSVGLSRAALAPNSVFEWADRR